MGEAKKSKAILGEPYGKLLPSNINEENFPRYIDRLYQDWLAKLKPISRSTEEGDDADDVLEPLSSLLRQWFSSFVEPYDAQARERLAVGLMDKIMTATLSTYAEKFFPQLRASPHLCVITAVVLGYQATLSYLPSEFISEVESLLLNLFGFLDDCYLREMAFSLRERFFPDPLLRAIEKRLPSGLLLSYFWLKIEELKAVKEVLLKQVNLFEDKSLTEKIPTCDLEKYNSEEDFFQAVEEGIFSNKLIIDSLRHFFEALDDYEMTVTDYTNTLEEEEDWLDDDIFDSE